MSRISIFTKLSSKSWERRYLLELPRDIKINKYQLKYYPLLDIIIAVTSNEKFLLSYEGV